MKSNPFAGCEDVLACPTCREPLALSGTSLRCSRNHCFDIARQGYVNLLAHHKAAGPYGILSVILIIIAGAALYFFVLPRTLQGDQRKI